jgi:acyl-CoA thioester hydrolase
LELPNRAGTMAGTRSFVPDPTTLYSLPMSAEHEIEIRVRYYETDAQGYVHHANYFQYFELARVEQLLAMGYDYADLERDGVILVVNKIACKYHRPCRFGDTLRLQIRTVRTRAARIDHEYRLHRGQELLAEAESTLACIDRQGRVQRLPDFLLIPDGDAKGGKTG